MKTFIKPIWIFLLTIIPSLLVICLLYNDFSIISKVDEKTTIDLWNVHIISFVLIIVANIIYASYCFFSKKMISHWYAIIHLLITVGNLSSYILNIDNLIPFSIPRWMVDDTNLYYASFLILPGIIHCVLIFINRSLINLNRKKAHLDLLIAIAIPFVIYFTFQIIIPLLRLKFYNLDERLLFICVAMCTIVFLYFILRSIYIYIVTSKRFNDTYVKIGHFFLLILIPLTGLIINNSVFGNSISGRGIFGNFNSFWFYVIAIINGTLLTFKNFNFRNEKLIRLIILSITLSFTIYFLLLFLPYLPISIFAIFAFGLGFLLLAPIIVAMFHFAELYRLFHQVKISAIGKYLIITIGTSIIPLIIIAKCYQIKNQLHEVMEYVFEQNVNQKSNFNHEEVIQLMDKIENLKERNQLLDTKQIPYIDMLYRNIVLDNLTLSDEKIGKIKKVFGNEKVYTRNSQNIIPKQNINIIKHNVESNFDLKTQTYYSTVELEIKSNEINGNGEFNTTFELPKDTYVSDYYLWIGDRKEFGILAERKTANWIYNEIKSYNRDPGFLNYVSPNKLNLKVFPFNANETRRTGIQFIHKYPISFNIDGQKITLGESQFDAKNILTRSQIEVLPQIKKVAKLHFLIDNSKNRIDQTKISQMISEIKSTTNIEAYETMTIDTEVNKINNPLEAKSTKNEYFFLEYGLKKSIYEASKDKDHYPILFVLSDSIENAITGNLRSFENKNLGIDGYYVANSKNKIEKYNFNNEIDSTHSDFKFEDMIFRLYKENNQEILIDEKQEYFVKPKNSFANCNSPFETAAFLQIEYEKSLFKENNTEKWLMLVKKSFENHTLSPYTTFISLETEAQKAVLLQKQKEVLRGNKNLDISDQNTNQMSEPELYWFLFAIFIFLIIQHKKQIDITVK